MIKQHVIVGMSGGVDSSLTAHKLLQAGYRVEGLFMFNWSADEAGRCQAAEDFEDAAEVCRTLEIPLHQADFSVEYRERVFAYFLQSYADGRTPNPDVLCNREIKFDAFLKHALRLGADRIATGHYARIDTLNGETRLLRGRDDNKDQSYFLAAVPQAALAQSLFPLGDMEKTQVREQARAAGLPVHAKRDSTGVCFIGERDFRSFLETYLPAQPGPIHILGGPLDGQHVGTHAGLMFHTLGQRRGLGLGGVKDASDAPWYVVRKDLRSNTLLVSQDANHPELLSSGLTATAPHWIGAEPTLPFNCSAQIRYRQKPQACTVNKGPEGSLQVHFDKPQRAVAPGQYIVFYSDDHCLGGAEISARLPQQATTATAISA